jgi:hypothetical protein
MGEILLWSAVGVAGLVGAVLVLRWLDKLLLRAEEKGWIYYRKKSPRGIVSGAVGAAMTEIDRIVRPSAEYRIQAEDPVVEDDEEGDQPGGPRQEAGRD